MPIEKNTVIDLINYPAEFMAQAVADKLRGGGVDAHVRGRLDDLGEPSFRVLIPATEERRARAVLLDVPDWVDSTGRFVGPA